MQKALYSLNNFGCILTDWSGIYQAATKHFCSGSFSDHEKLLLVQSEETADFYEQKRLLEATVHPINDVVLGTGTQGSLYFNRTLGKSVWNSIAP